MRSGRFWPRHNTTEQSFQDSRSLSRVAPNSYDQHPESYYETYSSARRPSEISDADVLRDRRAPPPINIQAAEAASDQVSYGGPSSSQVSSPTGQTNKQEEPASKKTSFRSRLGFSSSKEQAPEADNKHHFGRKKSLRKKEVPFGSGVQKSETDLSDNSSPPPSRQWPPQHSPSQGSEQDLPNFATTKPQAVVDPFVTYNSQSIATPVSAGSQDGPQQPVLISPPAPSSHPTQYQAYQKPLPAQPPSIVPYLQSSTPRQSLEQPPLQYSRPSSRQSYDSQGSTRRFPLHDDSLQSGPPSREGTFSLPTQQGVAEHMPPPPPPHKRMEPSKLSTQPIPRDAPTPAIARNESSLNSVGQQYDSDRPPAYQKGQPMPQEGDIARGSSPPPGHEANEPDFPKLLRDYRDLREKYSKVKRYYWERDDQVKQLQNTLAHQRLSQSRTSLDDGEYIARLTRLTGLVSQLAYSIRKDWKLIPGWLQPFVNSDAMAIGKQEMTAVGKAFVSKWLVDEVFDHFFHPALGMTLSEDLKSIQKNIRMFSPPSQSSEEEEALTAKIINWRLATIDGLQPMLASAEAGTNRAKLIDELCKRLVGQLQQHLADPPPAGIEGGVGMIVELAIGILAHLPMESRDVHIEYFPPGYQINMELMTLEAGIPSLGGQPEATAEGEKAAADNNDAKDRPSDTAREASPSRGEKKGGFLGSLMSKKSVPPPPAAGAQGKHESATASQTSLGQQGNGGGDDASSRVRMCVFLGMTNRSKGIVLYKAPVHRM